MTNYVIAFIFLLFAGVQYNDPDPFVWMAIYGLVAMAFIWKGSSKTVLYLLLTPIILYAMSYVPSIVKWMDNGLPSITGTMKAENPEVENMREFFGLIICIAGLVFRLRQVDK